MGLALEVIGAKATNPGAGPTAATPSAGDSFAVRNFVDSSNAWLDNLWGQEGTAGFIQVRSAKMHDNVRGIRERVIITNPRALLADQVRQRLYPQDALTVEVAGGAAETDAFGLLVYYEDIPGLDAQLAMWPQVSPRIANILTVELAMVAPTVAGDWSAGTALNAASGADLTKANTDYALLGYVTDTVCTSISVRGPDTGNVRAGGPGTTEAIETRDWFVSLSLALERPCIPIINSANKGATIVAQQNNAAAGTPNVNLILAELTR